MDNPLKGLFRQMTDKSEEKLEMEMPAQLRNAVFSTLDTTSLVADIINLFTVRFVQAHADVLDAIPERPYPNEKERLFDFLEKKRQNLDADDKNVGENGQNEEKN